jgi:ADP-L-glycero-D-manno-heptose 6-epimerase
MIIVTGGAGFIGSHLVYALNQRGATDILVVDNLTNGNKQKNLASLRIADYQDKVDFLDRLPGIRWRRVRAVVHLGACSSTTESDGRYMMRNNFEYSKVLMETCQRQRVPFLYASSASVYGDGRNGFSEDFRCESPLNVYAYSKFLFDQVVRRQLVGKTRSQVLGLRFFNVFGPQENHKGKMASVIFHFYQQIQKENEFRLFEGSERFLRDFVSVDDVVNILIHFLDHPEISGIFNAGTGQARSFEELATAVHSHYPQAKKTYIPFPAELSGKYQAYTQADLTKLRTEGKFERVFTDLQTSVGAYVELLSKTGGYLEPTSLQRQESP